MEYNRMVELIDELNKASKAYYQESKEIMTNFQFDELYDELVVLEERLEITLANSPTNKVGYEILSELPKEEHETPMLSLDKSKEISRIVEFIGNKEALVSWKMDGLTVVLTYLDGKLLKAVTRGNGQVGEVITNNAKTFKNLPLNIPMKGKVVIRGEAVISYDDFEEINKTILDVDSKYKNPRNLCSGSVRQLNNEITAQRSVRFFAFGLVEAQGVEYYNSREYQFNWLKEQGFQVVEHEKVSKDTVEKVIGEFSDKIKEIKYPMDGLVFTYDDINYGESLGTTAKFPRNAFAFKWEDEVKETTLIEIEWSASRTGLINPVAIFEPVELEGTTVARASVHNLSVLEDLELGFGDKIKVYKANMIIPQIAENLTRSNDITVPLTCPVCDEHTVVKQEANAKVLFCTNEGCQAKKIKSFSLFASRNALNIEGMSEATLEKFIEVGFLNKFSDLFNLSKYKEQIEELEGFGEKSYQKLITGIEAAKVTTLARLIYGLGIENVGVTNAKMICKALDYDIDQIVKSSMETLLDVDGVGEVIATSVVKYFAVEENVEEVYRLFGMLKIKENTNNSLQTFEGKVFVITGSVTIYKNRNEIKEIIESLGGKVTGSVSAKTNYLVNNDLESTSSKNKKARELEIPIISEKEFQEMIEV